ncbi:MAG TPA: homoserine kinase [Acidimicrobiales bacterium]|nr:MAG: homoserine kinase [Actinobacteria bacterium 21-64-8]HQT99545.1 homoserine kinase [Acidimicrobiales bacterium]
MFARVPASSANLGPGFDVLAVALSLYVEVSLELADRLVVRSEGCGAGLFDDETHLAVRVASSILGHTNFALHVRSEIPLSRGLGSSAALAVAAAAAAGSNSPLAAGVRVDGHAENAAASLLGGLVAATGHDDRALARRLVLDPAWSFVAVIPDQELATSAARGVLPARVPFADAVANLSALGTLIAGLAHHEDFVATSMDDTLHQPYRASLLPYSNDLLACLRDAGAAGSCWSGAGSTMLALVTDDHADDVAIGAREFLEIRGVAGEVRRLQADTTGLVRS